MISLKQLKRLLAWLRGRYGCYWVDRQVLLLQLLVAAAWAIVVHGCCCCGETVWVVERRCCCWWMLLLPVWSWCIGKEITMPYIAEPVSLWLLLDWEQLLLCGVDLCCLVMWRNCQHGEAGRYCLSSRCWADKRCQPLLVLCLLDWEVGVSIFSCLEE